MKFYATLTLLFAGVFAQLASANTCPAGLKCAGNSKEESFLVDKISNNACFVVSKSYCPYCMRAKQALKSLGATCEIVELDQRADGHELQRTLAEMTGRRTVPNVFIGGTSVGGSDDTLRLNDDGSLKRLLKEAKAL